MNAGDEPGSYGSHTTYTAGADYLDGLAMLEDWGCGRGFFRTRLRLSHCRNIDGSPSPNVDRVADLTQYESRVNGIFIRHVLEHEWDWQKILANALRSFEQRMMIVLFTPWSNDDITKNIAVDAVAESGIDVPDLSFSKPEMEEILAPYHPHFVDSLITRTQYRVEHLIYLHK